MPFACLAHRLIRLRGSSHHKRPTGLWPSAGSRIGIPNSAGFRACSVTHRASRASLGLRWRRKEMTLYLGKREVKLMQLGPGHTSGDIVAWVPDAGVMFTGDLIEYHSACYCGDAHWRAWPQTLNAIRYFDPKAIAPGRGDALSNRQTVLEALAMTRDFVSTLYGCSRDDGGKGNEPSRTRLLRRARPWTRSLAPSPSTNTVFRSTCPAAFDEASGIPMIP